MRLIQNASIKEAQQNIVPDLIDLDEAKKPEGKFVEFEGDDYKKNPPGFEYPYDVQFKNTGMIQFRCSSLEVEELNPEMKLKSLRKMLISLGKHVDHQIELELTQKKHELEKKYNDMYGIDKLLKKAYDLSEKLVIETLGRGKLEEKWNEAHS